MTRATCPRCGRLDPWHRGAECHCMYAVNRLYVPARIWRAFSKGKR